MTIQHVKSHLQKYRMQEVWPALTQPTLPNSTPARQDSPCLPRAPRLPHALTHALMAGNRSRPAAAECAPAGHRLRCRGCCPPGSRATLSHTLHLAARSRPLLGAPGKVFARPRARFRFPLNLRSSAPLSCLSALRPHAASPSAAAIAAVSCPPFLLRPLAVPDSRQGLPQCFSLLTSDCAVVPLAASSSSRSKHSGACPCSS